MRIKMLKTVHPDLMFLSTPGTILRKNLEYEYKANKNGAISGLCENKEKKRTGKLRKMFMIGGWIKYDI